MKRAKYVKLLALILLLTCLLSACALNSDAEDDPLVAYNGTWYLARNGVACNFGDGKIYRDDKDSEDGQALIGIYSLADDHIDAHITGTGGLKDPKPLYIVSTDEGDILCNSADGRGTIYFYREPLAALAALEEAEQSAATQEPSVRELPISDEPLPSPDPDDPAASTSPLPPIEAAEESAEPLEQSRTNGSTVWVSKSGSKYHRDPSCSGMKSPSKLTKSEAESKGYTPCKRCY